MVPVLEKSKFHWERHFLKVQTESFLARPYRSISVFPPWSKNDIRSALFNSTFVSEVYFFSKIKKICACRKKNKVENEERHGRAREPFSSANRRNMLFLIRRVVWWGLSTVHICVWRWRRNESGVDILVTRYWRINWVRLFRTGWVFVCRKIGSSTGTYGQK